MKNTAFTLTLILLLIIQFTSCTKDALYKTAPTISTDDQTYSYSSESVSMVYQSNLPNDLTPVNLNQPPKVDEDQSCSSEDCDEVTKIWVRHYQAIANETGIDQYFCVVCCLDNMPVYIILVVRPRILDLIQETLSELPES